MSALVRDHEAIAQRRQRIASISSRNASSEGERDINPSRPYYRFIGPYCLPTAAFSRRLTIRAIKTAVCRHYDITEIDLVSDRRTRDVAYPRQVAMYLAKTRTFRSFPYIGRSFGNRDHTTVMHAVRAVTARRITNPDFDAKLSQLEARL